MRSLRLWKRVHKSNLETLEPQKYTLNVRKMCGCTWPAREEENVGENKDHAAVWHPGYKALLQRHFQSHQQFHGIYSTHINTSFNDLSLRNNSLYDILSSMKCKMCGYMYKVFTYITLFLSFLKLDICSPHSLPFDKTINLTFENCGEGFV